MIPIKIALLLAWLLITAWAIARGLLALFAGGDDKPLARAAARRWGIACAAGWVVFVIFSIAL